MENYAQLVNPRRNEAVPVRAAALRALGQLGTPAAANIIVDSLADPDETIRLEAVRALRPTADYSHSERLYEHLKDSNPDVRQESWAVLRNLFDQADNAALTRWAERSSIKEEPDRRIEIYEILAKRLFAQKDLAQLATVQQNIGEDKMKLSDAAAAAGDFDLAKARAGEADKRFESALQFLQSRGNNQDMATSAVMERRMDALLVSGDYPGATGFAADCINRNAANTDPMGAKLRSEVARLRGAGKVDDALKLIDAIKKMNPPLAGKFLDFIQEMEQDLRTRAPAPRSAIGSSDSTAGNSQ